MSVLDRFMDMMRLNDDYDDDEYYDDDLVDEEYEEEPKPRRVFGRKSRDDYDDGVDDESMDRPAAVRPEKKASVFGRESRRPASISPMRAKGGLLPNMEVCVVKPTALDDSREIINTLLAGRTVILNLEGLDLEVSQRIIDFTSGATYAIDGHLQKISSYIFLVTPTNVDISGDLQDLLSGGALGASAVSRY